jgi:hypothetical protein
MSPSAGASVALDAIALSAGDATKSSRACSLLGATPSRSGLDPRATVRTISDAAEHALPRGARGENARRARALTASGRPTSARVLLYE